MRKAYVFIKREFLTRVKGKAFIISTIITPMFLIGIIILPGYLMQMKSTDQFRILVSDPADLVFSGLEETLNDTLETGKTQFSFTRNDALNDLTDTLKASLEKEEYTAYLYVPPALVDSGQFAYYAKNVSNWDLIRPLRQTVNKIILEKRISSYNLDPELIESLTKKIEMRTVKIRKGKTSESGFGQDFIISYIFVLILYITILIYGQMTGRGVLEDKQNRIVEVLLSSGNPRQLMAGKLIGIGSVGLLQYLIWALAGASLLVFGMTFLPPEIANSINLDPTVFIYFVVFFVLGYFLYSSIYLAIASMVNSEEEFQQMVIPVIFLVVAPLLLMGVIVKDPNSQFAVISSLFPFFTPMLMMMRVTITTPPMIEVVGSILILIGTTWFMIWLSGKIYRTGILMYGKKPSLPEILKWIRYK